MKTFVSQEQINCQVLDPACGSRMMWFNKNDPRVIFGDIRFETKIVPDHSCGNTSGHRVIVIAPDMMMDFRSLPFPNDSFRLVVFDPPHLVHAGEKSWLAAKYGKLGKDWREDLRTGFIECFRVLSPDGILIFKWSEVQVKLKEILSLTPQTPLFGNTSGKKAGTHWIVFMKPSDQEVFQQ